MHSREAFSAEVVSSQQAEDVCLLGYGAAGRVLGSAGSSQEPLWRERVGGLISEENTESRRSELQAIIKMCLQAEDCSRLGDFVDRAIGSLTSGT